MSLGRTQIKQATLQLYSSPSMTLHTGINMTFKSLPWNFWVVQLNWLAWNITVFSSKKAVVVNTYFMNMLTAFDLCCRSFQSDVKKPALATTFTQTLVHILRHIIERSYILQRKRYRSATAKRNLSQNVHYQESAQLVKLSIKQMLSQATTMWKHTLEWPKDNSSWDTESINKLLRTGIASMPLHYLISYGNAKMLELTTPSNGQLCVKHLYTNQVQESVYCVWRRK